MQARFIVVGSPFGTAMVAVVTDRPVQYTYVLYLILPVVIPLRLPRQAWPDPCHSDPRYSRR